MPNDDIVVKEETDNLEKEDITISQEDVLNGKLNGFNTLLEAIDENKLCISSNRDETTIFINQNAVINTN